MHPGRDCISAKISTFGPFMKECVQPYYLQDGEILECGSFSLDLINKGKSIYEVARLWGKGILFLDDHIERLYHSIKLSGYDPLYRKEEIKGYLARLLRENPATEGNVKFVMNYLSMVDCHFIAYFVEHRYPSGRDYRDGVKVIFFPFERDDPNKKIWRPGFRKEVMQSILQNNAFEALLIDRQGSIPEASKSNIFAIQGETIITPPDELILPGITRKYVLRISAEMGIPVILRRIITDELEEMDGLFLTGTSIHVLPVSHVNGNSYPSDNPILQTIIKEFDNIIKSQI
jgi:branched-chain amino acid aminotransferase